MFLSRNIKCITFKTISYNIIIIDAYSDTAKYNNMLDKMLSVPDGSSHPKLNIVAQTAHFPEAHYSKLDMASHWTTSTYNLLLYYVDTLRI